MRLQELTESVSSVIYHATSFETAHKILQSDYMKGPEISFTRSLQGAYHTVNKLVGVIFEMDGNKLNHNYKGGPVGTEQWDNDPEDYDPNDKSTWTHTGRDNKQLEDRIYAKAITNISKYIKSAIIFVPAEYLEGGRQDEFGTDYESDLKHADHVVELLKSLGIPYRFVASEKGLSNRKTDDKDEYRDTIDSVAYGKYPYSAKLLITIDDDEDNPEWETREIDIGKQTEISAFSAAEKAADKLHNELGLYVDAFSVTNLKTGEVDEL